MDSSLKVIELLDKSIEETKDLQLLNELLDMKLSSFKSILNSTKINFNPSFVLANDTLDFDFVCNILKKVFQVCNDFSNTFQDITKYITGNYKCMLYQSNIVKLLHLLVSLSDKDVNVENIFAQLKVKFVWEFLLAALNNSVIKVNSYETLTCYYKLFLKTEQINCLNAVFDFCFQNNNLDVFCGLLNYTPKELMYSECCCFSNDSVWLYVESCISGLESHLQKQGEYILSKYAKSFPSSCTINHNIAVQKDFENSWQAFFILIDIGREKQLHLVTPSLSLFKYIINLPFLWQKCAYKIYLGHSQNTIVYQVAIEILKRRYAGDILHEILKIILPSINNNEYTDLSCKMFETLRTFCAGLDEMELEIVIKNLVKISWNAVSFWKVIQNVFVPENEANKNVNSFQEVISCALNLPNVYIRTECLKYLITIFWDANNYNKMHKIANLLKASDKVNFQYFQSSIFSTDIIDLVINDLIQFADEVYDFNKIKTCFIILKCLNTNVFPYVHKHLQTLSPHVALFVWREHMLSCDSKTEGSSNLHREIIETFLITYFNEYLFEDSTDHFIELFKLVDSQSSMATNIYCQIIERPLVFSDQYFENQIYVALVLLQYVLLVGKQRHPYSNTEIEIKQTVGGLLLICVLKNNNIVNNIEVKDSRICNECINLIFKKYTNISCDASRSIINIFTNICEYQGNRVLHNLYLKLPSLFRCSESINIVIDFIDLLRQNLMQIKKDQYFKGIVNAFIQLIYSQFYLDHSKNNESKSNSLLELSESYPFVRLKWITSLNKICLTSSRHYKACLVPVVEIYIQGAIITKDERTEFNLCQEFVNQIECNREEAGPSTLDEFSNPNLLNAASRLLALESLLCIAKQDIKLVIDYLRERYLRHFNKRYFPDSKVHYEKLRIVQVMLVLVSAIDISEGLTKEISIFVFQCFQEETNQNCVKQLLNWILILTLKEVSPVLEWIEAKPNQVSPSILISIIPTIYHLTLFGNEEALDKTIKIALPWTMGAQFKLRAYAQDLIRRIIEHAKIKKYDSFLNKYKPLEDCVINCIESSGDIFANSMKTDLVFLNDFHAVRDKSLSSIFYDIPRLNKVHHTEWRNMLFFILNPSYMEKEDIQNQKFTKITELIAFQPKKSAFADAVDSFLNKDKPDPNKQLEDHVDQMLHIQKKITPWKSALESGDTQVKTDFILIASLIDKSQNLGGLSRTCEVFGIRDIAFNDAKVTNEKEFKSLSRSSEAWIKPIEVKIKDLRDYVLALQNQGYMVIGAEQTAGSRRLNEFQFPCKMALVLGNEKTGIPPDIIPLLNVCLEIPQFGQTRSLNVHVAGATFIWEYAKQHLV